MTASGKLGADQAGSVAGALLVPAEAEQRRQRAAIDRRMDTSKPRSRAPRLLAFVAALVGMKIS